MFDDFETKNSFDNDENNGGEQPEQPSNDRFDVFSYLMKNNEQPVQEEPKTEKENTFGIEQPVFTRVPEQPVDAQSLLKEVEKQSAQVETPTIQEQSVVQNNYIPRPPVIEAPASASEYQKPQSTEQPTVTPSYMPRPQTVPITEVKTEQPKKSFDFASFFKKNWSYVALGGVSLLLVITIILNIVLIGAVFNNKIGTQSGNKLSPTTSQAGETLNITESPQTDTAVLPGSTEKLTFAQIAAKVRPSVVSIITYDLSTFGQSSGQGSGIIYSSDGYIVTNAHVIDNSKTVHVTVVLSDDREFEATVMGYDTRTDLAVLKINATGLPAAEFGESEKLVVGDEVIAIGNPGGEQFAGSTTNGIVSGVDRVIDADSNSTTAMKYIQTNAAINPGNSGGALVNMYGQVIGINTAKISATGYEGLGFAIPIATAKPVIDDLSSLGYVSGRVKLGITCTEVTSAMAQYYNVPTGLLIYSIDQNTELYSKAQVGDIIDKVDGKDISSLSEMQDIFATKKVGDTVTLDIYRPATTRLQNAETFTVTIHLLEDKGDTQTEYTNGF